MPLTMSGRFCQPLRTVAAEGGRVATGKEARSSREEKYRSAVHVCQQKDEEPRGHRELCGLGAGNLFSIDCLN